MNPRVRAIGVRAANYGRRVVAWFERLRDRAARATLRADEVVLRALARLSPSEQNRIYGLTLVIGGICGLAAVLFHLSIRGLAAIFIEPALRASGSWWIFWTILTPTLGALVAGLILHFVVPSARGSGVPHVKAAYAIKSGRVRMSDVVGKFVLSAIQLGTGASLGREGPTVQICAGIASNIGRIAALSPTNQRRMLAVGAAAGIAAAFNAPIAAVTFVIEELVGALDTTVLSGVVVAAAIAAVVEHSVLGEHPVFLIPHNYGLHHASSLIIYVLLGVAAAFVSEVFSRGLLGLRARFSRMTKVRPWARPAIGGLITGLLAVAAALTVRTDGIAGGGYETLGRALNGGLSVQIMLVLGVMKLVATVSSYSSGGAGGIFAPVLFIGGMLGGVFGHLDTIVLGHTDADIGAFAVVGMGAVFAGVIRAPITSVLLMFEMTGGYGLVLPLMVANMVAYVVARRRHHLPIYEALLEQDGVRLPDAGSAPQLAMLLVQEAMTSDPMTLSSKSTVHEGLLAIRGRPYASYPILDDRGDLAGVISEARLRRTEAEGGGSRILEELARPRECLRPSASLRDALEAMSRLGVRQMAVVDDVDPRKLVGILAMSDVMRAMLGVRPGVPIAFPPSDATGAFTLSSLPRLPDSTKK